MLDLVPAPGRGGTLTGSLCRHRRISPAQRKLQGAKRFWVAEHHAMDGDSRAARHQSCSPISANATSRHTALDRAGSCCPITPRSRSPKQFGTLDALFPGRIDLRGVGRAPGAGPELQRGAAARICIRHRNISLRTWSELRALLTGDFDLPIKATPGLGAKVELWMLVPACSARQLAAKLGLPYAFAAHLAARITFDAALAVYRRDFQPSDALDRPHGDGVAGMNVFAAGDPGIASPADCIEASIKASCA